MAIVKKNILGTFQGSLSNIVFRERNGKVVAYLKPAKQKVSKSKAALIARNKFSLAVALAKEINADETLSFIWSQAKVKATNSYQKLIKINSKLADSFSLSTKNIITPVGIPLDNVVLQLNNNFLEIVIDFEKLDKDLLKADKLFCLIHLWKKKENSISITKMDFVVKLFKFDLQNLDKNTNLNFLIDIKNLGNYRFNNGIALLALTNSNTNKNKLIWSSTLGKKFI
uniref:Uncharacterized protein n=1 Tax=Ignavibacterium album TaxID=591197 RepID=A0A832D1M7_9BACT